MRTRIDSLARELRVLGLTRSWPAGPLSRTAGPFADIRSTFLQRGRVPASRHALAGISGRIRWDGYSWVCHTELVAVVICVPVASDPPVFRLRSYLGNALELTSSRIW